MSSSSPSAKRIKTTQSIESWLSKFPHHGYVNDKLSVTEITGRGNCVIALEAIGTGELLVSVPGKACITPTQLSTKFTSEPVSDFIKTVVLLIQQLHSDGAQSGASTSPYIESLPETVDTPMTWNRSEQLWLNGTNAEIPASATDDLRERFVKHVWGILQHLAITNLTQDVAFKLFKRAIGLVTSRAFHGIGKEAGPILIPYVDLLNHTHHPDEICTVLESAESENGAYFFMKAKRDIRKGEEVVHSYGPTLSDRQLLLTYGFTIGAKETQSCCISPKDIMNHCEEVMNAAMEESGKESSSDLEGTLDAGQQAGSSSQQDNTTSDSSKHQNSSSDNRTEAPNATMLKLLERVEPLYNQPTFPGFELTHHNLLPSGMVTFMRVCLMSSDELAVIDNENISSLPIPTLMDSELDGEVDDEDRMELADAVIMFYQSLSSIATQAIETRNETETIPSLDESSKQQVTSEVAKERVQHAKRIRDGEKEILSQLLQLSRNNIIAALQQS